MRNRACVLFIGVLSVLPCGWTQDKTKVFLPEYVLQAKTVAVLIDPNAGVEVTDPEANRNAQKDVETALSKWGRFLPVVDSVTADLLIVVRKGNGKAVNTTIYAPGQNRRPGAVSGTDTSILIGGKRGKHPNAPTDSDSPLSGAPHPQVEMGGADDAFLSMKANR